MNDLSWFLYFADILPRVSSASGVGLFIFMFAGLALVFANVSAVVDNFSSKGLEILSKLNKFFAFSFSLMLILFLLIPSKETIYMIAGSEAGEYVVNTPEAKAILSDIQEVIQLQIEQLKPDDRPATN